MTRRNPNRPTPVPTPEAQVGRNSLKRVRRLLLGRESLESVYGPEWLTPAADDLQVEAAYAYSEGRTRTAAYLDSLRDGLLLASRPKEAPPPHRVRLDTERADTDRNVGPGYQPAPPRSILDI